MPARGHWVQTNQAAIQTTDHCRRTMTDDRTPDDARFVKMPAALAGLLGAIFVPIIRQRQQQSR